MHLVIALAGVVSLLAPSATYAATEVNTCGQAYSGSGYLTADLDCSASSADIDIERSGKLELRGFTLTGSVLCRSVDEKGGSCKVIGPGAIVDGDVRADLNVTIDDVTMTGGGVQSFGFFRGRARIRDSTITGSGSHGVTTNCCKIVVTDSSITGHAGSGIFGGFRGSVKVNNSDISSNDGFGIENPGALINCCVKTRVKNSTINNNGIDGINVWQTLMVSQTTISGNAGAGVSKDSENRPSIARIRKSTITGNNIGVHSRNPMDMTDSVVTDNATFGVLGPALRIVGVSVVTGNSTDSDCGIGTACADVASVNAPTVAAKATCDSSYVDGSGVPGTNWGVCSLD